MKKMIKTIAMTLAVATLAVAPAMAEATAVETLCGTDIDEAGTALGLDKTSTEGEEGFSLTMYENNSIIVGGHDGAVTMISVFDENYSVCGVVIGMTVEEAEAALDANGVSYVLNDETENGVDCLEFIISDTTRGYFDLADGTIVEAQLEYEAEA